MQSPDTAAETTNLPFEFTGKGSEYFRIWIVNLLLSIVTLGIYSAWARVRTLNYFYGNTHLHGNAFSFPASPIAILKGRLLVAGILIVFTVLINLVSLWFTLLFVLVLIFGTPWLVVRALRFRAVNSAYRNVRFNFHGTIGGAAVAFLVWPAVAAVTLWVLFPVALMKQRQFLVENHAYGTSRFAFKSHVGPFFGAFFGSAAIGILVFIVALLALVVGMIAISGADLELLGSPGGAFFASLAGYASFLLAALAAQAWFQPRMFNVMYGSSRLREHGFAADMTTLGYFTVVAVNVVLTVLTLGFFYPFAKVRPARYKAECLSLRASGSLDGFVVDETAKAGAFGDEAAAALGLDFGF